MIDVAIIGAGASGITAAISVGRLKGSVVVCEKMPVIGKKILSSGSGRCNLANDVLDESFYAPQACGLVRAVFSSFGKKEIINFFRELGLFTYSQAGRIFPVTNQAQSVLSVLKAELKKLGVAVKLNFAVQRIFASGEGFTVESKSGESIACRRVIIAAGGKSYPAYGSDGSGYALAEQLGHRIIPPVPSCVPLVAVDRLCHFLQGQRIQAIAQCVIAGKPASLAQGELLFTRYGLSGTAILDVSAAASVAINREGCRDVFIYIDMVPFMGREDLEKELSARLNSGVGFRDLFMGILPDKFGHGLQGALAGKSAADLSRALKNMCFKVTNTRGWNEAEFTAGGVDPADLRGHTLESNIKKGVYFCGEMVNVEAKRGGYNLAWAWASGFTAGKCAYA